MISARIHLGRDAVRADGDRRLEPGRVERVGDLAGKAGAVLVDDRDGGIIDRIARAAGL